MTAVMSSSLHSKSQFAGTPMPPSAVLTAAGLVSAGTVQNEGYSFTARGVEGRPFSSTEEYEAMLPCHSGTLRIAEAESLPSFAATLQAMVDHSTPSSYR